MTTSHTRYELLRVGTQRFTRALHRLEGGDGRAFDAAWVAVRRLRELLPVLQADPDAVRKLSVRLRKLNRRLAATRDLGRVLQALDDVMASEPRGRQAASRVRADVQKLFERARADLTRKKTAHETDRLSAKLAGLTHRVKVADTPRTSLRDLRWAVNARIARRAVSLKDAILAAGSVYLAERLHRVQVVLTKLRFGAELGAQAVAGVTAADRRAIVRLQSLLDRLQQIQLLIDRIRHVQSSLATPDLKAWRDLDNLVTFLERRCRALHARYIRERDALITLCDGLVARAPLAPRRASGAKRKAS